jgi:hypothetical protein
MRILLSDVFSQSYTIGMALLVVYVSPTFCLAGLAVNPVPIPTQVGGEDDYTLRCQISSHRIIDTAVQYKPMDSNGYCTRTL